MNTRTQSFELPQDTVELARALRRIENRPRRQPLCVQHLADVIRRELQQRARAALQQHTIYAS